MSAQLLWADGAGSADGQRRRMLITVRRSGPKPAGEVKDVLLVEGDVARALRWCTCRHEFRAGRPCGSRCRRRRIGWRLNGRGHATFEALGAAALRAMARNARRAQPRVPRQPGRMAGPTRASVNRVAD